MTETYRCAADIRARTWKRRCENKRLLHPNESGVATQACGTLPVGHRGTHAVFPSFGASPVTSRRCIKARNDHSEFFSTPTMQHTRFSKNFSLLYAGLLLTFGYTKADYQLTNLLSARDESPPWTESSWGTVRLGHKLGY